MYDAPKFTVQDLNRSTRTYRKSSKGSDHWLASELAGLPLVVASPIAEAIDSAVVAQSWAHQSLLNLHPELSKAEVALGLSLRPRSFIAFG